MSVFEEIRGSESWLSVEKIEKGWSSDEKYHVRTQDGRYLQLRISAPERYAAKKKECEIIEKFSSLGFPISEPVGFGRCAAGTYMLLTWVEGDDLEKVLPTLSKEEQYRLGREAGGIPVILYNVPSRTGLNITPETALELSRNPLINGIKEASGNISQVAKIAQLCGDELNIYSGNDDQVVPLLSLGGKGVISVVSNVKPELVHNCCKAWFEGDTKTACKLQLEILPLADALFCEVNPIPVKYAMNVLGWEAGSCRLPLVEPSDAHKEKIEQALEAEGLIQE